MQKKLSNTDWPQKNECQFYDCEGTRFQETFIGWLYLLKVGVLILMQPFSNFNETNSQKETSKTIYINVKRKRADIVWLLSQHFPSKFRLY